jgi:ribonuclease P protein component
VISGRAAQETFSRSDRLRKRTEFEECYSGGVRVSGRHFLLFLRRRTDPPSAPPRLGISVSKKVGNAVARNRVKRRLREIFRRSRPNAPVDIVVNARPSAGAAATGFSELVSEWESLIAKALAIRPPAPRPRPARPPAPSTRS